MEAPAADNDLSTPFLHLLHIPVYSPIISTALRPDTTLILVSSLVPRHSASAGLHKPGIDL